MNVVNLGNARSWLEILQTSRNTQTAVMTLAPGKSSGPKGNDHSRSEQTLLVIEGEFLAEVVDEQLTRYATATASWRPWARRIAS